MTPLLLGTVAALYVRLLIPGVGPWIADVDLDLSSDKPMPTGRVVLTCGGEQLIGTVEPEGSGRFGEKARVRIIAGAGAWHHHVTRQEFHNDAGLKSTDVLTATAGAIGETIVEAKPIVWDVRYARAAGPASSVLDGLSWYVDAQGLTQVRTRPAKTPTSDVELLNWFVDEKRAELAADTIVWPGTVITDARIGSETVREVEQVFSSESGARVQAWMTIGDVPSTESTRYHAVMRRMVQRFAGVKHLRAYKYRIVLQGIDGRLTLQAVDADSGIPDTLPVSYFSGQPGDTSKVTPGTLCLVHFTEGDPRRAIVAGFDSTVPLERHIDATTVIELGAGGTPLAHAIETLAEFALLTSFLTALKVICDDATVTTVALLKSRISTLLGATIPGLATPLLTLPTIKVKGF